MGVTSQEWAQADMVAMALLTTVYSQRIRTASYWWWWDTIITQEESGRELSNRLSVWNDEFWLVRAPLFLDNPRSTVAGLLTWRVASCRQCRRNELWRMKQWLWSMKLRTKQEPPNLLTINHQPLPVNDSPFFTSWFCPSVHGHQRCAVLTAFGWVHRSRVTLLLVDGDTSATQYGDVVGVFMMAASTYQSGISTSQQLQPPHWWLQPYR